MIQTTRELLELMYKEIAAAFSFTEVDKTKIKVKFLIQITNKSQWFLTKLQSERPQIHDLYNDSGVMFISLLKLVVQRDNLDGANPHNYPVIDVDAIKVGSNQCGYLGVLADDFAELPDHETRG